MLRFNTNLANREELGTCTSVPVFTLSAQKEKTLGMRWIEPINEKKTGFKTKSLERETVTTNGQFVRSLLQYNVQIMEPPKELRLDTLNHVRHTNSYLQKEGNRKIMP